jgi:hypothetical protein
MEPTQEELERASTPEELQKLMAQAGETPTDPHAPTQTNEPPAPAQTPAAAPTPAAPAPANAPAPAAPSPAPSSPEKPPAGFVPTAAIRQARVEAATARRAAEDSAAEAAALRQQLEDIRTGKTTAEPEDIARMREELPHLAPVFDRLAKADKALAELQARANAPAPVARPSVEEEVSQQEASDQVAANVNAVIDTMPLLAQFRDTNPAAWKRAAAIDADLVNAPAFAGKPMTERFAEVQRRVATEFGFTVPASTPGSTPAASAPSPSQATIEQPQPQSLTDLAGGMTPSGAADSINQSTGAELAGRFEKLATQDDIMAEAFRLAKAGAR